MCFRVVLDSVVVASGVDPAVGVVLSSWEVEVSCIVAVPFACVVAGVSVADSTDVSAACDVVVSR